MSIRTTHHVNRDEALAIILAKKGKDKSDKSNEWLGDKLDEVVDNCFYNFIVVDTPDEEITSMYSINRYTVPNKQK